MIKNLYSYQLYLKKSTCNSWFKIKQIFCHWLFKSGSCWDMKKATQKFWTSDLTKSKKRLKKLTKIFGTLKKNSKKVEQTISLQLTTPSKIFNRMSQTLDFTTKFSIGLWTLTFIVSRTRFLELDRLMRGLIRKTVGWRKVSSKLVI